MDACLKKGIVMNKDPEVSVLMAAFNERRYIRKSVQSILDQTFSDWELVVVDDGSTDGTQSVLQSLAGKYPEKIRVCRNAANFGLAASLNKGLALCNGRYIARMDADDWCYPRRLEKQVRFMESHPLIDVLGTGAVVIGQDGHMKNMVLLPESHEDIEAAALKRAMFFHPSVMARESFFENAGGYGTEFARAEDLELWLRGLACGCRYHNLGEALIQYRSNGYIRSHKSVFAKFDSRLRLCHRYGYHGRAIYAFIALAKSLLVKYRLYVPRAVRGSAS